MKHYYAELCPWSFFYYKRRCRDAQWVMLVWSRTEGAAHGALCEKAQSVKERA